MFLAPGLTIRLTESQASRTRGQWRGETTADPIVISITKDAVADTLGRLCCWHRRLCDLVDMVTSCYELPLFVVIAYCFANSVFGTYNTVATFRNPHYFVGIAAVVWLVAYVCRLILIGIIPSVTVAQVS